MLFGLFALVALAVVIFQLAGTEDIPWVTKSVGLWGVAAIAGLLALAALAIPVRSKATEPTTNTTLRPSETEPSTNTYSVAQSLNFYDHVADVYDARITRENLDSLRNTAKLLLASFPHSSKRIEVLDVGAGTGQFLHLLEGADRVNWTCIEPSAGMASVLRRLFQGPPLRPEIFEISLEDVSHYLGDRQFDAIVLNFVLSSLTAIPDFTPFYRLLHPNGILVVCDAHPDIRTISTAFRIRTIEGIHSLEIQHRTPSQIAHHLTQNELFVQSGAEMTVTKMGQLYSYVLCFRKATVAQSN